MTRTSILAGLFALAASAALAQTNAGNLGGMNLDPGNSGGTTGLLSGGGTVSSTLNAREPRTETSPRVTTSRAEAKSEPTSETKLRSNSGTKAAAKTDPDDDPVSERPRNKAKKAKEKKEAAAKERKEAANRDTANKEKERRANRLSSYPYVYSRGLIAYGYPRVRY